MITVSALRHPAPIYAVPDWRQRNHAALLAGRKEEARRRLDILRTRVQSYDAATTVWEKSMYADMVRAWHRMYLESVARITELS